MKTKGLLSVFIVLLAICFLPDLAIWIHQKFVFGLNPFVALVLLFIIILVSIPLIIKLYSGLIRQSLTDNDKEPVLLFALGGLCWMIVYWKLGDATFDFHYGDTMYVLSSFEVWKYISIAFGIYCLIYFVFPVVFGRDLNIKLSRIHFWVTFIGLNILVGARANVFVQSSGRYIEYAGPDSQNQIRYLDTFIFTVLILIVIAQLLLLFNIISSLFRKNKI
jgi:heme/copper-type cytochrome/quinol oxidase subunit 1